MISFFMSLKLLLKRSLFFCFPKVLSITFCEPSTSFSSFNFFLSKTSYFIQNIPILRTYKSEPRNFFSFIPPNI